MRLVVSWRSATPIKQALVRAQIGGDVPVPTDREQFLAQVEPSYVVSASGLPPQFARMAQTRDVLMPATALQRANKQPILPDNVQVFGDGETATILYFFPKDEATVLDDREVEFVTVLGPTEIKKKFKLDDMRLGERPAL